MSSKSIVRLLALRTQKGAQVDTNAPQLLSFTFSGEIPIEGSSKDEEIGIKFFKAADFVFDPTAGDITSMITNIESNQPMPNDSMKEELKYKIACLLRNVISEMNIIFSGDEIEHGPSLTEFIEVCCANKTAVCGMIRKVNGELDDEIKSYSTATRLVPGSVESYYKQQTLS